MLRLSFQMQVRRQKLELEYHIQKQQTAVTNATSYQEILQVCPFPTQPTGHCGILQVMHCGSDILQAIDALHSVEAVCVSVRRLGP